MALGEPELQPVGALLTIERALESVVFQRQLVDGTRAMLGVQIASPDAESWHPFREPGANEALLHGDPRWELRQNGTIPVP